MRRGLLFSLPLCLYAAFILVVDPFNFVGVSRAVPDDVKLRTAFQLNPCLWKMNEFNRRPQPNILLGDSRMMLLRAERIKELTGEDFYNFAYGGASLREMIDTFWFAARREPLRKVYVGLNLTVYDDYNYTERTKTYTTVARDPALYFVNRTVLQSAVYAAYSRLARADLKIGVPTEDRETFWGEQLERGNAGYYRSYVYPSNYRRELEQVAAYCREHGIELAFVIFPSHVEAQRLVGEYRLDDAARAMRRDLAALAPVYDFDYENQITLDRANYDDPNHFVKPVGDQLIREVWLGQLRYARKYQPGDAL